MASKQPWSCDSDPEEDEFLNCVVPSEIGQDDQHTSGPWDTALQQNQIQRWHQEQHGTPMVVLDPSINLQMALDVRKLLNRKSESRPKPLLRLVCRGCGLSTHDADPFLPQDYVEFLDNVYVTVTNDNMQQVIHDMICDMTCDMCK